MVGAPGFEPGTFIVPNDARYRTAPRPEGEYRPIITSHSPPSKSINTRRVQYTGLMLLPPISFILSPSWDVWVKIPR